MYLQRVSSEARAADLHSTDLQAELRHQQELSEEKDAELRRLQKVGCLTPVLMPYPILQCCVVLESHTMPNVSQWLQLDICCMLCDLLRQSHFCLLLGWNAVS